MRRSFVLQSTWRAMCQCLSPPPTPAFLKVGGPDRRALGEFDARTGRASTLATARSVLADVLRDGPGETLLRGGKTWRPCWRSRCFGPLVALPQRGNRKMWLPNDAAQQKDLIGTDVPERGSPEEACRELSLEFSRGRRNTLLQIRLWQEIGARDVFVLNCSAR